MDDRSFIEHSLWGVLRPHFDIPVYDSRVFKWYSTFNGYVHIEELLKLRKANNSNKIAERVWEHKDNIGFYIRFDDDRRLFWYHSTEWLNDIESDLNISCYNYLGEGEANIRIIVQEAEHEFWGII